MGRNRIVNVNVEIGPAQRARHFCRHEVLVASLPVVTVDNTFAGRSPLLRLAVMARAVTSFFQNCIHIVYPQSQGKFHSNRSTFFHT